MLRQEMCIRDRLDQLRDSQPVSGKGHKGSTGREGVKVHDIRRIGPGVFIQQIRQDKVDGPADIPSVCVCVVPEIVLRGGEYMADSY